MPWMRGDSSALVINVNNNGSLYLNWDNTGTKTTWVGSSLLPGVDGSYTLGDAAHRWDMWFDDGVDNQTNLQPLVSSNGRIRRKSNVFQGTLTIGGTCAVVVEGGLIRSHSGTGCP
jgi:hypothetical protein